MVKMKRLNVMSLVTLLVSVTSFARGEQAQGRIFGDIIRFNPIQRLVVGLQITLPLSAFAPNWEIFGRSTGRSSFSRRNLWSFVQKPRSTLLSCPTQRVELEDYLSLMQIEEESCQERFICDLASDPTKYQPLSQILLPKLAYNVGQLHRESGQGDMYNTSTYFLLRAAKIGVDPHRKCEREYSTCSRGADSMVNMWAVWGWQMLSKYMDIKFLAETDAI